MRKFGINGVERTKKQNGLFQLPRHAKGVICLTFSAIYCTIKLIGRCKESLIFCGFSKRRKRAKKGMEDRHDS